MKRYFFDVVREGLSEFDFRGYEFATPEKAFQLAELIAIDLEISPPQGQWAGSLVKVRDTRGREFFSRRVEEPEPELAAV
jgi:hypothetical protein